MAALLQRSHPRLGVALGLAFGLGLTLALGGVACFIEPAPPASFRFECSSDSECEPTERCAQGLCQQPCGGETNQSCGQTGVCLNGYCSSTCSLADPQCSSPQTCTSLTPPGVEPSDTGICMVPCDDQNPCAEGSLCYEDLGLCVAPCMTTDECGEGEECIVGACVPSFE